MFIALQELNRADVLQYLVAGSITILWSFIILFFLPADPIRAKRVRNPMTSTRQIRSHQSQFTSRERYIAVARMRENNAGIRNTHFKTSQLRELLLDVKFWLLFATAFCMLVVNGPVSTFTPIIINQLGFSGLNSLLLVMPAGAIIGTIELMTPYIAMKYKGWRCWLVAITVSASLLACCLLWQLPISSTGGRLFAVYILASYGGGYAVLMSVRPSGLEKLLAPLIFSRSSSSIVPVIRSDPSAPAASSLDIVLVSEPTSTVQKRSSLLRHKPGNFLGPIVFKATEAPEYRTGWITTVATLSTTIVLIIVYRLICVWDNKKRDQAGSEGFDHAYEDDFTDLTNKQFRYTL